MTRVLVRALAALYILRLVHCDWVQNDDKAPKARMPCKSRDTGVSKPHEVLEPHKLLEQADLDMRWPRCDGTRRHVANLSGI